MIEKKEKLKNFLEKQAFIKEKIEHYKSELAKNEEKIESVVNEPLAKVRLLQGKDTGTITAMVEGFEVKQDMPKKVVWDQEKLSFLHAKIRFAGDDVDYYIQQKFSVSESNYKNFTPAIKTVFMQAREIKPGKAKLTFKIKEV